MKHARRITTIMLLALTTSSGFASAQMLARSPEPRGQVTANELRNSPSSNLFDFVRAHRPLWLNSRGPDGAGSPGVVVYVDGMRRGGVDELRLIPTAIVATVSRLSASEASLRWGAGHTDGAIVVTTGDADAAASGVAASRS